MIFNPFVGGLTSLSLVNNGRSRSINAENPHGEKGKGCTAASGLGPSRKGSPCLENLNTGSTATIAEIDGPGIIEHIWITVTDATEKGCFVLRDLVLRMYWDGETGPSVESPLGDFFCNGFARECEINSLPVVVNPTRGFNSFFPMPFGRKAKITIENQHAAPIPNLFYQIDYCLYDELPKEMAYFHAQWKRQKLTSKAKDYTIVEHVQGKGQYIGTYLAISSLERYWWGEGEVKFYIDGDILCPTLCSTGTEDYFGGAWSFAAQENGRTVEKNYCTPFMGYPYYSAHDKAIHSLYHNDDCPPMRGLYRWHIPDPIRFSENIRVTLQQIGSCKDGLFERQDDIASVAYWYQMEPHQAFCPLPPKEERWPR